MDTPQTILVVDDESTIREVIRRYLERDGYTVVEAATGRTALEIASREKPDLIVLDLMLPGVDGLALTRQLRERGSQVPIVMLTAKGSTADRIHGLDTGADDYLAKPFSPQELMSRIRAVLRRAPPPSALPPQTLVLDDLQLDPGSRVVMVHGKEVALTAKEFDL
ncbi:MAG: response regulator transcription factor, partial [Chloroflexi bacterium]|nr:response regulator transcription factor [Chloroflexota bacterium]